MNVLFPYDNIREIQSDFIKDIIECIKNKHHLIAHAPTGIGKTASVLSSVLPYIIEKDMTLFFLTSRHTQHKIAVETLKQIKKKYDSKLNVVDFIGKRNMCSQMGAEDLPGGQFYEFCRNLVEKEECEFYENLWSNIGLTIETRKFLEENKSKIYHVEEFLKEARKTRLCPYELALLNAKKANVIIADYYHVFNPTIREAFFKKSNKFLEKCVIIVDEAHNLPSRLRDMMSSSITTSTMDRALKEAKAYPDALKILKRVEERFNGICSNVNEERLVVREEFIFDDFEDFIDILENAAEDVRETKRRSSMGTVAIFLKSWIGNEDGFVRFIQKENFKGRDFFRLNYNCLDPSINTPEIINKSLIILMSGTLTPFDMYRDLLGFKDNVILKEYENPFPKENRLNLVVPDTSTKFTKRNPVMFKLIAQQCAAFSHLVPGNVLVFFPSYQLMNIIYDPFKVLNDKTLFIEKRGMTKEEKEEILNKFRSYKKSGAVLFAVSGGSFSEGVDLPGDELKGVIVVGLPLSKPNLETKSLIDYYDGRFGKGWDYAYIFPAMMRVIQSAGRCIRSENDRGVIMFLDERYSMSNYFRCFPKDYNIKVTKMPEEHIKKFFEN